MLDLPEEAKKNGVRIRWWQPQHRGLNTSDWALDQVVISGRKTNPNEVKDGFSNGPKQYAWLQADNVKYGPYCGSKSTVTGQSQGNEDVTLTSTDLEATYCSLV